MKKIVCVLAAASMAFAPVFAQSTTPAADQQAPVVQQVPVSLDGMQFAAVTPGVGTGASIGAGLSAGAIAALVALAVAFAGLSQTRTTTTHSPR